MKYVFEHRAREIIEANSEEEARRRLEPYVYVANGWELVDVHEPGPVSERLGTEVR